MLTIRMQRGGRSGHPQYRVIVQDSRFSPLSGRVVAQVGTYDPHTKATTLESAKIEKYISNGAQPSDRVASLLRSSGMKLPSWVKGVRKRNSAIRNVGKLKRNTPEGAEPVAVPEAVDAVADAPVDDAVVTAETTTDSAVVEETVPEVSVEPEVAVAEVDAVDEPTAPAVEAEVVEEVSETAEEPTASDEVAKA